MQGQRGEISKLLHSCMLTSRHWGYKSNNRKLIKVNIQRIFNSLIDVMPLENFLRKCSMGYTLYPWISLLESTLETSYKPQT